MISQSGKNSGSVVFYRADHVVGRTDFCEPQLNLLAHAQAIELHVGSRCGGHGICGGDRIRISTDQAARMSGVTEKELQHLNPAELEAGCRLACQCYPNESVEELRVQLDY